MKITFLKAADNTPLTKTFSLDQNKQIQTTPYPHIKNFTSYETNITTIEELYAALQNAAGQYHCLLKGTLDRPLVNESRAEHTDPNTPTSLLVLDLDFDQGFPNVDDALQAIDPELVDCDYVVQASASAGVRYMNGLRVHAYVLLTRPVLPQIIKNWMILANLKDDTLRSQCNLSANGFAIRWASDITVCQNDKLIYIAPPICETGVTDKFAGNRITLVKRTNRTFTLDHQMQVHEANAKTQDLIDELRKARGLRKRTGRFSSLSSGELLLNPEQSEITGVKFSRGYCYVNLNGGDSWGYWFPEDNPEILYNFKGEPNVRLRDLAPTFYANYLKTLNNGPTTPKGEPFVFRETIKDQVFSIFWDKLTGYVSAPNPLSKRESLINFCKTHNVVVPDPLPELEIVFDPTSIAPFDPTSGRLNLFKPSPYMLVPPNPQATIPPTIEKVIRNICVDGQTFEHHINWLATWFQTRKKLGTAYIFSGTTGTGKGVYRQYILEPLFGPEHCVLADISTYTDSFNSQLETALLSWGDELELGVQSNPTEIWAKLKTYITEERISIRGMRVAARTMPNYTNFIIATNNTRDPLPIEENDRRVNVAPPCERKLIEDTHTAPRVMDPGDIDLFIPSELYQFAAFLNAYKIDEIKARQPLRNQARTDMIRAGRTTIDDFFAAAREGNLDYFITLSSLDSHGGVNYENAQAIKNYIRTWAQDCRTNSKSWVTGTQLLAFYRQYITNISGTAKFDRICRLNGITLRHRPGQPAVGIAVRWLSTDQAALDSVPRLLTAPQPVQATRP